MMPPMRPGGLRVRTTDRREFVWYGGVDRLEAEHPGSVVLYHEGGRPYEGRQPGEPKPVPVDLAAMSRPELNEHAEKLGIDAPHALPNKDAVVAAIVEKDAAENPVTDNAPPIDAVTTPLPPTVDHPVLAVDATDDITNESAGVDDEPA